MNSAGHHPDAKDFVAVDPGGKPYKLLALAGHVLGQLNVRSTFSWEAPVLAPFDGVVVAAENSCSDREKLNAVRDLFAGLVLARGHKPDALTFFLGNHIVLKSQVAIYALLCHLKKGSVRVQEGEGVKSGQTVAAIGNSGNTIQPHLHFQLMDGPAPLTASPLPFVLQEYEEKEGKAWRRRCNTLPRNYQVFRSIPSRPGSAR